MRESVQEFVILQLTPPVTFSSHSPHDAESGQMIGKETQDLSKDMSKEPVHLAKCISPDMQ